MIPAVNSRVQKVSLFLWQMLRKGWKEAPLKQAKGPEPCGYFTSCRAVCWHQQPSCCDAKRNWKLLLKKKCFEEKSPPSISLQGWYQQSDLPLQVPKTSEPIRASCSTAPPAQQRLKGMRKWRKLLCYFSQLAADRSAALKHWNISWIWTYILHFPLKNHLEQRS